MTECALAEWRRSLDDWNARQRKKNHGDLVWVWTNEDQAEGDWWHHCKDCGAMTLSTLPVFARPTSKKESRQINKLLKRARRRRWVTQTCLGIFNPVLAKVRFTKK